jgi:hypothetical protein
MAGPVPRGRLDISKYPENVALLSLAVEVNDTEITPRRYPLATKWFPPRMKVPEDPVTERKVTVAGTKDVSAYTSPEKENLDAFARAFNPTTKLNMFVAVTAWWVLF